MHKDKVTWNKRRYDYRTDDNLNSLQKAHIKGEINLYEPVEAYKQEWYHKGKEYHPVGSPVQEDLSPIYIQWKDDYRKRNDRTKRHTKEHL